MKLFRSDIYENLKMALSTLRANKLRSFLTVLGVMIGVITVMLISTATAGEPKRTERTECSDGSGRGSAHQK